MYLRLIRQYLRDRRGNFAVILALMAVPVVGVAGLGLDYSRILRAEQQLQAGLDAALSAAAVSGGTSAAMQNTVRDFVLANVEVEDIRIVTTIDTYSMQARASYELPLPVLAAVGKPQIVISADGTLVSRTPLRDTGGIQDLSEAEKRELQRRFEKALSKAPHRYRRELQTRINRLLRQQSGPHYLAR